MVSFEAPKYFKQYDEDVGEFALITLWLVLMCAVSVGINSIYVNNYMTRPDVPFGQILNDGEKAFLYAAFSLSLVGTLLGLFLLARKFYKKPEVACPATISKSKAVKDGDKTKEVKETENVTASMVQSGTAELKAQGKDCNVLRDCADPDENYNAEQLTAKGSSGSRTCRRRLYGTTTVTILGLVVSLMGLTTSITLMIDTLGNTESRHQDAVSGDYSGGSTTMYTVCLIFAIASGAVPVVFLSFIWGKSQCAEMATVTKEKIVEKVVKGKVTLSEVLAQEIQTK